MPVGNAAAIALYRASQNRFMQPSPVGSSVAPSGPPRMAGISGWAQATGRPFRTNPSGSITMMDRPGGPGQAPLNRNLFASGPGRVTELLQRVLNGNNGTPNGRSGLDHLSDILRDENARTQGAADRQFQRNQGQIDEFGNFVNGIDDRLMGQANQSASSLEGYAGGLDSLGNEAVASQQGRSNDIMGSLNNDLSKVEGTASRIEGDANTALGYAAAGVRAANSAVSGYDAASQANISATVAGINQQLKPRIQMVNAGLNPDGSMMSPQERDAARRQLSFDTSQAVSGTVAQMRDDQSRFLSQLQMGLSGANMQAGNVALGAAGARTQAGQMREGVASTRAGVGTTLSAQGLEAEQVRAGYRSMASNLLQMGSNLRNSAAALATQLEASGRTAMAEMVRSNPESVVSSFASWLQLYSISTAPGGRSIPRIG